VGCRRPTPGNGYLEAITSPNVTCYTEQLQKVTEKGFIDSDGKEVEVDVIICATGFDTSFIPRFPIVAYGKDLRDVFAKGSFSYLAVLVPGFPNLLWMFGAYGPLGHGSALPITEALLRYHFQIIRKAQIENIKSIGPREDVTNQFIEHSDLFLKRTAWYGGCASWFKGGTKEGIPKLWPGTRLLYLDILAHPRYEDMKIEYETDNRFNYFGNGFNVREYDGRDLSYYLGLLGNEDVQPDYVIPPYLAK